MAPWTRTSCCTLRSGRYLADESYCYQLSVAGRTDSGYHGAPLACQNVRPVDWSLEHDGEVSTLVLLGHLDFGPNGPTSLRLEHRISFSSAGRVVERLSIVHHRGRDRFELIRPRFGFRKTLFARSSFAWLGNAAAGELVPVPLRRHAGQGTDHHFAGYSAADLFPEEWTSRRGLPGRSAEAWLWAEPGGGFLVAKYNQEHIEFSLADGDYVTPRRGATELRRPATRPASQRPQPVLALRGSGNFEGLSRTCRRASPRAPRRFRPQHPGGFRG